jgi:glutaconate CoA-transferase, subunit A
MTGKVIDLTAAVQLVPPRDAVLALGGMTLYRRPMAFALALSGHYLRHSVPSRLTLLSFTGGPETDVLIGLGAVERLRSCYVGLEVFGLAPHFTRKASTGELTIIEESEASLAYGLRAAMAGVGFMPSTAWQGTDLLRLRPDVKTVVDPYSGETLTAFPAVTCDVAVIHALQADKDGNALIGGNQAVDRELALIADTVIITAETIVDRLDKADIIGPVVDAVVHTAGGAWPTSCHPLYPLDGQAILDYVERAATPAFRELLRTWASRHGIQFP